LKQRVALWCRLDCLSQQDAESYIRHRLKVAGYEGSSLFDAASISYLWEHTAGTPRLINAACDNALLNAFATSKKIVSVDIMEEVVRDLRMKQEPQRLPPVVPDRSDFAQAPRKIGGGTAAWDVKITGKSRQVEDQDRQLSGVRHAAVAAGGFASDPLAKEWEDEEFARPAESREYKRQPMRNIASVAELKERKNAEKERVIEIAESQRHSRSIAANGDGFVPPRKFNETREEPFVSAAFFEKLSAALTDAMGPMAAVVLEGGVAALGESLERFPVVKLCELIQQIKGEILSGSLRAAFEKQVLREIERYSQPSDRRNSAK
jgi:hypothetical protein